MTFKCALLVKNSRVLCDTEASSGVKSVTARVVEEPREVSCCEKARLRREVRIMEIFRGDVLRNYLGKSRW